MYFVMKLSKLCNLRCAYCYEYEELGEKARMPIERLAFFFEGVAHYYQKSGWQLPLHFVLHGGEPALLPLDYIRSFAALQRQYLASRSIPYLTSLQSNLTRTSDAFLETLVETGITLGASIDVFGAQRLNLAGRDSQERVLDNLQRLFDRDIVRRLSVGAITVLHRENCADAVNTFHFFNSLGLSYRILPVFSLADPPPRMKHLTLAPHEVVTALQKVARAHTRCASTIQIHPLQEYMTAAVRYLAGQRSAPYDPEKMEWALIVNTNGDAYNHSEAYTADGLLGNIFRQPLGDILGSDARRRTLEIRARRARTCEACLYDACCSRVPIVEALPSERAYDAANSLRCLVARPMIEFLVDQIQRDKAAITTIRRRSKPSERRGKATSKMISLAVG
ncbi:radical SAM protein [Bradyrhizobium sp. UFLA 03-164]|uniref:Radical SAM protein n=2 Tax=Bradyrhizobium uaiense TaxID=2594946 RepID=A0A6P1BDP9_9BRAD|nr:radical SAM protein [Bradyrhizobium uaiense]